MTAVRKETIDVSIRHPDYSLFRQTANFIRVHCAEKFATIVDYGAGERPYANLFLWDRYYACDIERNSSAGVDRLIDGGQKVDLADGCADLVICMDVLEHCEKYREALDEIHRLVRVGGSVLIGMPFLYREHEAPNDHQRFTSFFWRSAAIKEKFEIVRCQKIGNPLFTIYSLLNEMHIKNPEIEGKSFVRGFVRGLNLIFLPIMNRTLFQPLPDEDDTVYHHLLLILRK